MKKLVIILGSIFMLSLAGCVKQKKCDCDCTGTWQYLEEPYDVSVSGNEKRKIVAHITDATCGDYLHGTIRITGNVPKGYTSLSPISVNFCAERLKGIKGLDRTSPAWKLKCIEKED